MKQIYILVVLAIALSSTITAQTPSDGFFMTKGDICIAAGYQHEQWKEYWEGTLLRDNPNLGTVSTRSIQAMAAYGLTKRINLIAMLPPYIRTRATAGTLAGHSGLQDAALWLKFKPVDRTVGKGLLHVFLAAGGSIPASNYYPDFLPLSIGLAAKTASFKGNIHYFLPIGLFVGVQGGYHFRSNIHLERDFYYAEGVPYYTDKVAMPNAAEGSVTVGYYRGALRTEVSWAAMNTLGGGDIRRNEMPFPSYNMDMQRISWMAQYRFPFLPGFGVTANAAYTLNGRNVGQSTMLGGGVLYQFPVGKKGDQKTN